MINWNKVNSVLEFIGHMFLIAIVCFVMFFVELIEVCVCKIAEKLDK